MASTTPREHDSNCSRNIYPTLLTLHGTGLTSTSQADAYKMMPYGRPDYVFGVNGFWVIAPTRHGAHNWEVRLLMESETTSRQIAGSFESH
jgi:hypothetical protein